ncbi:MAG TPA: LTA synthase family protein, partial [Accumulibacter sp.]|nr:LTA synthase family protein [Accumulibacter sp.]
MAPDAAFTALLVASSGAIACSLVIERLMTPRPRLLRPASAWALHIGLCASAHAVLTLLLGRPWFAGAALSAFLLLLVLVNNAKMKALREPFVFQDYEYFTDAIRHPRLYIPFLGWGKFIGAASGFVLAVLIGLLGEAIPDERFVWSGQLGAALVVLAGGILLVLVAQRKLPAASFVPENDVRALGLLSSLWLYRAAEQLRLQLAFPFQRLLPGEPVAELPHLVAVQSESFFDARALHPGIRRELLSELDRLQNEALAHGKLQVPAWGANTVRSEFAFLSGIAAEHLGVHRFNPYRAVAAGNAVPTLASHLQRLGYRTICIHPYPASFYRRDRAYPRLGFGEFLDLRTFDQAERDGPYVSDAALAEQVAAILRQASGPLFIFVITMENHGPLHLERV